MENNLANESNALDQRIHQLAEYLLLFRKIQDKTDADFLETIGNLNMQELNVINIIGDNEPCIMSDIAKASMLSLSSITVIINKLVKAKYVQRVRCDTDRRIIRGSLTSEGHKIYAIQIKHVHDVLRKMFSALSSDEQESFLKIFQKITSTLI